MSRSTVAVRRTSPRTLGLGLAPYAVAALLVGPDAFSPDGCPSRADGGVACRVFEGVVPGVLLVTVLGLALSALAWILLTGVPRVRARRAAGERLRRTPAPAPFDAGSDALLAAAAWAQARPAAPAGPLLSAFAWRRAALRHERLARSAPPAATRPAAVARPLAPPLPPPTDATRAAVLPVALDRPGMARLEEVLVAETGARVVVVELAPVTALTDSAVRGVRRALTVAAQREVRVVFVVREPRTRQALARIDAPITIAASTTAALEWAAALAPVLAAMHAG